MERQSSTARPPVAWVVPAPTVAGVVSLNIVRASADVTWRHVDDAWWGDVDRLRGSNNAPCEHRHLSDDWQDYEGGLSFGSPSALAGSAGSLANLLADGVLFLVQRFLPLLGDVPAVLAGHQVLLAPDLVVLFVQGGDLCLGQVAVPDFFLDTGVLMRQRGRCQPPWRWKRSRW